MFQIAKLLKINEDYMIFLKIINYAIIFSGSLDYY